MRARGAPNDREILHVLTQEFIVDDMAGIRDPRGMTGIRLDARVHGRDQTTCRGRETWRGAWRRRTSTSKASSSPPSLRRGGAHPEEREVGVALMDFGGGTVEIVIFFNGALRHTYVLPLGGSSITSDIAIG